MIWKIIKQQKQTNKNFKNEDSLVSGKISSVPTFVLQGFKRRKETEKGVKKKLFKEIMTKNFPNMGKETYIQV